MLLFQSITHQPGSGINFSRALGTMDSRSRSLGNRGNGSKSLGIRDSGSRTLRNRGNGSKYLGIRDSGSRTLRIRVGDGSRGNTNKVDSWSIADIATGAFYGGWCFVFGGIRLKTCSVRRQGLFANRN